jgi:hypothetical protein
MAAPLASAQTVGTLEAVVSEGVTETSEPVSPTAEFAHTVEHNYVALKVEKATSVRAEWIAVKTEGGEPNHKLSDLRLSLRSGQRGGVQLKAPAVGLPLASIG